MGRQPKKRIDLGDFRPIYETDNKSRLKPSEELLSLTARLGIEHIIATKTQTCPETGKLNTSRRNREATMR